MSGLKMRILKIIFFYIFFTTLIWIFAVSYSNTYNRMNEEKISPVTVLVKNDKITVNMLHSEVTADIEFLLPESKFYYSVYLLSDDSMRLSQAILIKTVESFVA